ncbi:MAG: hypothetical protein KIT25_12350 [Enhydrobacter sp.]|nr:MAG: hypothetical protein KIT25_12350 [Enhydrobacter sp.]
MDELLGKKMPGRARTSLMSVALALKSRRRLVEKRMAKDERQRRSKGDSSDREARQTAAQARRDQQATSDRKAAASRFAKTVDSAIRQDAEGVPIVPRPLP